MGLSKYKLGELIEPVDERNKHGFTDFYGINKNKELMPTVANTEGIDYFNYKIVKKNRFVFSGMQTGRDKCIRIALYMSPKPVIVSPAYTTFEIIRNDIVIPEYFFMFFLSPERDRLGWFYSDSSIRSNLDWDRFCNIELSLPPIDIQQKYVDIYKALVANQKAYESGAEDLKLVCDAYIEDLRRKLPCEKIGKYIRACDERNTDLSVTLAQGITVNMEFENPKRIAEDTNATRIVRRGQFAYNKVMKSNRTKLPIALRTGDDCIVSGSYQVFEINDPKTLLPEYLMIWLMRPETQRFAGYRSWGSTRDVFTFDDMCDVKIPIPDIKIQRAIADVYRVYNKRKELAEKLKEQIKNICPILVRGAIEEGENARIK